MFALFHGVSGKENPELPTKTALKRESQGRKLVAGTGFEPVTFRL